MMWFVLLLGLQAGEDAEARVRALIRQIAESGRVMVMAEPPSARVSPGREIPPGAPPLLSFRYFAGRDRHRFGRLDLVMDDAGH
ncbi:MAG: hypothetical protein HYZ57_01560 [Acidobacteria bacterium]|nr:hypothetical protein [Acidobacteriota bacterium]MBI3278510.1 hypothetical protein [Acidobacteriota bacterium]